LAPAASNRIDRPATAVAPPDGRDRGRHVVDQWMSTRHARIERTVGGFLIADEGSKNGLLLNGERTVGALLVDGDWIEAGHTLLRYRVAALPPAKQSRSSRSGAAALATVLLSLEHQSRDLEDIARSTVS